MKRLFDHYVVKHSKAVHGMGLDPATAEWLKTEIAREDIKAIYRSNVNKHRQKIIEVNLHGGVCSGKADETTNGNSCR